MRQILEETFFAALAATHPAKLVQKNLPHKAPNFILAIGKAALTMLEAAREAYPEVPFLAVPPNGTDLQLEFGEIIFGSHPIPSLRSVKAAERALEILENLTEFQHVLMLISGGGSSIFCAPWGVTLEQKQDLTRQLLQSGADITEINTVRKNLSRVKGGRLAASTKASVTALILSDVVGDDPSVIASGLTAANTSTFEQALAILEKYNIKAPEALAQLMSSVQGKIAQTARDFGSRVQNIIIGSNVMLLNAAKSHLESQNIQSLILSDQFTGETRDLAGFHAAMIKSIRQHQQPVSAPIMLISGGEATVTVRGNGFGGRNQEFMLWLLQNLGETGVHALSAGSDGIDGNSLAAGAFLSPDSHTRARAQHLEIQRYLANNDSATFFSKLEDSFITGATGHNLNDIRLIFVE